jgi:hypothetical protein
MKLELQLSCTLAYLSLLRNTFVKFQGRILEGFSAILTEVSCKFPSSLKTCQDDTFKQAMNSLQNPYLLTFHNDLPISIDATQPVQLKQLR